jgi:hypothetical protein
MVKKNFKPEKKQDLIKSDEFGGSLSSANKKPGQTPSRTK